MEKVKIAYSRQIQSKKFKKKFWSLRMVQGTIKITKNLNPPCWTFMTVCTLRYRYRCQTLASFFWSSSIKARRFSNLNWQNLNGSTKVNFKNGKISQRPWKTMPKFGNGNVHKTKDQLLDWVLCDRIFCLKSKPLNYKPYLASILVIFDCFSNLKNYFLLKTKHFHTLTLSKFEILSQKTLKKYKIKAYATKLYLFSIKCLITLRTIQYYYKKLLFFLLF